MSQLDADIRAYLQHRKAMAGRCMHATAASIKADAPALANLRYWARRHPRILTGAIVGVSGGVGLWLAKERRPECRQSVEPTPTVRQRFRRFSRSLITSILARTVLSYLGDGYPADAGSDTAFDHAGDAVWHGP